MVQPNEDTTKGWTDPEIGFENDKQKTTNKERIWVRKRWPNFLCNLQEEKRHGDNDNVTAYESSCY